MFPPQKIPASLARLKAQIRSRQLEEEDREKWQPLVDAANAKWKSPQCDYCGYSKNNAGMCTNCFRT